MLRKLVRVKEVGLVYRIMIVEDDRELRETLKELLILKNYDVITSGSVKEFDEHTDIYDMYLLDVKLPDGTAMTISIGIATAFENASRYQELVRMADSAMFRAKYNGRNKVALAKEEKMVPKTSHYTQDQLKRLNLLSKREGIGEAILLREAMDMLLKKYDV